MNRASGSEVTGVGGCPIRGRSGIRSTGCVADRKHPGLGPHLRRHVGEDHPLLQRKGLGHRAHELHRPVGRPVGAHRRTTSSATSLAPTPVGKDAVQDHTHALRNPEPDLAR